MKRLLFFLVLALSLLSVNVTGYAQSIGNQDPVIIIISTLTPPGQVPRSPIVIPISGYVFENEIDIFFNNAIGEVGVCLKDAMDNTIISTTLDSSNGLESIPFSGLSGSYTIMFNLEDNTCYIGRFEIQ